MRSLVLYDGHGPRRGRETIRDQLGCQGRTWMDDEEDMSIGDVGALNNGIRRGDIRKVLHCYVFGRLLSEHAKLGTLQRTDFFKRAGLSVVRFLRATEGDPEASFEIAMSGSTAPDRLIVRVRSRDELLNEFEVSVEDMLAGRIEKMIEDVLPRAIDVPNGDAVGQFRKNAERARATLSRSREV